MKVNGFVRTVIAQLLLCILTHLDPLWDTIPPFPMSPYITDPQVWPTPRPVPPRRICTEKGMALFGLVLVWHVSKRRAQTPPLSVAMDTGLSAPNAEVHHVRKRLSRCFSRSSRKLERPLLILSYKKLTKTTLFEFALTKPSRVEKSKM